MRLSWQHAVYGVVVMCAVISLALHALDTQHLHPSDAVTNHQHAHEEGAVPAAFDVSASIHAREEKGLLAVILALISTTALGVGALLRRTRRIQLWHALKRSAVPPTLARMVRIPAHERVPLADALRRGRIVNLTYA